MIAAALAATLGDSLLQRSAEEEAPGRGAGPRTSAGHQGRLLSEGVTQ
jgi:hypothetical protein